MKWLLGLLILVSSHSCVVTATATDLSELVLSWVGPNPSNSQEDPHRLWIAQPKCESMMICNEWHWSMMDAAFQSQFPPVFAVHQGRSIIVWASFIDRRLKWAEYNSLTNQWSMKGNINGSSSSDDKFLATRELFLAPTTNGLLLTWRTNLGLLASSVYPFDVVNDDVGWSGWVGGLLPHGSAAGYWWGNQPITSATLFQGDTWVAWQDDGRGRVFLTWIEHIVDDDGRTIDAGTGGLFVVTRCGHTEMPISQSTGSPAVVNHNNELFAFWIDRDTHIINWASTLKPDRQTNEICTRGALPDQFKAKPDTKIQAFSVGKGDSSILHLFWSADRDDGAIQWGMFDNLVWSTGRPLPFLLHGATFTEGAHVGVNFEAKLV